MYLMSHHRLSQRRACALLRHPRSTHRYRSAKDPQLALRQRMREIAQVRVRYGYRRIHVLLRRVGWKHSRGKDLSAVHGVTDFVADALANGSKFRLLTVIDVFSRAALAIEVGSRLRGQDVVDVLNRLAARHGAPKFVFVDNGSEFTGRLMDMWAYHHKVRIDFSRPGKPTDNGHVETFNGSLRDECLNLHWFESLAEAKASVEAWRRDYNEVRPHSALMDLAPTEFARQARVSRPVEGLMTAEN